MASKEVQKVPLHCPSLEEVAQVLQTGLSKNFAEVEVSVVDCPDLTKKPFMLAEKGLCGHPRVADVGGVPHLVPTAMLDKKYNLEAVAEQVELPGSLVVGAGAGPWNTEGVNCEMMANIKTGCNSYNNTHICKVNPKDGTHILKKPDSTDFFLLGNFFICDGLPGKVLEMKAAKRTGPENFMSCVRKSLEAHYGTRPVGVGGTFLLQEGRAKIHVMPDFSKTPLQSDDDVNNWLRFYDMPGPLVCVGELMSCDPRKTSIGQYDPVAIFEASHWLTKKDKERREKPHYQWLLTFYAMVGQGGAGGATLYLNPSMDLDLRIEHFHCFSDHGDGGHYHYDTTPDDVRYLGYFNVAEYMYRIDRPHVTHQIGRD